MARYESALSRIQRTRGVAVQFRYDDATRVPKADTGIVRTAHESTGPVPRDGGDPILVLRLSLQMTKP